MPISFTTFVWSNLLCVHASTSHTRPWTPSNWASRTSQALYPVNTIQPVVKPIVWQPAVSCKQTYNRFSTGCQATVRSTGCQTVYQPVECLYTRYNRLSNRLHNRFDNRLTTGCIVYTNIQPVVSRVNGALRSSPYFANLRSCSSESLRVPRSIRIAAPTIWSSLPSSSHSSQTMDSFRKLLLKTHLFPAFNNP